MKNLITLLFLVFSAIVLGQTKLPITSTNLQGEWTIDSVQTIPNNCGMSKDTAEYVYVKFSPNNEYTTIWHRNGKKGSRSEKFRLSGNELILIWPKAPNGNKRLVFEVFYVKSLTTKTLCLERELTCGTRFSYFTKK